MRHRRLVALSIHTHGISSSMRTIEAPRITKPNEKGHARQDSNLRPAA